MDKKLTDSEITIKALKELLEVMLSEGDLQRTSTISHTIDLINRLQVENKRLKTEKDNLIKTYSECQIANLQEFMHRVENKLANNTDITAIGYQSVIGNMEQTYKEMVGDK